MAREVEQLLEKNESRDVRLKALNALKALGTAAETALPNLSETLCKKIPDEKDTTVRQALKEFLQFHLKQLNSKQPWRLSRILHNQNDDIVLVGLAVVRDRKQEAAGSAQAVAQLLNRRVEVRVAALKALEAIGPAVENSLRDLTRDLLELRNTETDDGVLQALRSLLGSRLAKTEREKLKEQLLPLLQDSHPDINLVGLKVVREHKEKAADVAAEVADLLKKSQDPSVHDQALMALKAIGPAAAKALPKLFEIFEDPNTPKSRRTRLAIAIAEMGGSGNFTNDKRLVSFLLDGLHPEALEVGGGPSKEAINRVLPKFGQTAIDSIFKILDKILDMEIAGKNNIIYREELYHTLTLLGPEHRLQENYNELKRLYDRETKKQGGLIGAASKAISEMKPR